MLNAAGNGAAGSCEHGQWLVNKEEEDVQAWRWVWWWVEKGTGVLRTLPKIPKNLEPALEDTNRTLPATLEMRLISTRPANEGPSVPCFLLVWGDLAL